MNPSRIQYILEKARGLRLLVVGDVMLDEFVWGRVSRISPEAPVPVVEVQGESLYPGGAANVARNLRPFCAAVEVCGVVGCDGAATRLRALLDEEGISTAGLLEHHERPTTLKTRIVARQQQVVRVDREHAEPLPAGLVAEALASIRRAMTACDGVIIEDYGKGLIGQELVAAVCAGAHAAGKPVTADPNPRNPLRWDGVRVLKPNRGELFAMAGVADPGAAADPLADAPLAVALAAVLASQRVEALLVTLGEHGMVLAERDSPLYHSPARAREVFDVSGAGDTAIALFTLALCSGASLAEAAEIANHAAGVVVGKLGTATLDAGELAQAAASAS